ncbi:MAG: hypothetical protein NDI61_00630 [Bdellovibrionaceae bacterium]|nr:hypothetical protein [Pseudobdellovibrionaceae bacterium]
MYRFRRPKKRKFPLHFACGLALAATLPALIWLDPPTPADTDVRTFAEGLKIQINRASPAFAALEDTIGDAETDFDDLSPFTPMEILASGEREFTTKAQEILASNHAVEEARERAARITQAQIATDVEKLAQRMNQNQQERVVLAESSASVSPKAVQASLAVSSAVQAETDELGAIVADPGSLLVSGGQIRALDVPAPEVPAARPPVEHAVQTIRLSELKIERSELIRSLFFPLVTADQNHARAAVAASVGTRARTSPTQVRVGGLSDRRSAQKRETEQQVTRQALTEEAPAATLHQLVVAGPLEMTGGLALTSSSDQIVVYREAEGERLESGYVWLRDGRYEIYLQETLGQLVGELQTASGDVLGRGHIELSTVRARPNQYQVDGLKLTMQPVIRGIRGQVLSAYSHADKVMTIPGAAVDLEEIDQALVARADGRFQDDDIAPGSVVITKVRKQGHWGTLAFVEAGSDNKLMLFPNSMMSAFRHLSGLDAREPIAVVWGRVSQGRQPVAGATVELLTGEENVKPIYFNSLFIPDPSLTATSANGAYAFIIREPGVHAVQAFYGQVGMEPVLFPVEAEYVSSIDLEVERSRKIDIRVFDAFRTDVPLAAEITPVGSESAFSVGASGHTKLNYALGTGLITLDVDAGDQFSLTRINLPRERGFVYAPMVEQRWVDEVRNHRRISKDPASGTVVGFVEARSGYQVHLRPEAAAKQAKIVYFDARGHALWSPSGVAGGGYVIFNVPEGFATVSVVSAAGSSKIQSVTALTESRVINVFNHSLR